MLRTIAIARPERLEAELKGDKTYFTGRPCKHGHVAERLTSTSKCVRCLQIRAEKSRAKLAAYMRNKRASMLAKDPVGTRAKWNENNRQRRKRDPEAVRACERKNSRLKRQRNPKAKLAQVRARQAAKIQRTPAWADLSKIRAFYEACPPGHDVDHVIPLRGRLASGLHVIDNLQYLPSQLNRIKGASFNPENMVCP